MFTFLRRESLWIPVVLLVLCVACWIELDLYAPSFPEMMHAFATTEQMMQWTLSLNFLGFFFASLLCGPLADSFGRRKVILGGALIFVFGSLICLFAPSIGWMLLGRLIQGIGVSAPVTVTMAVVADIYQGEKQVKLLSKMNSTITITMALAPIIGVYLTAQLGWQANFALIFVMSLLGMILVFLFVPETHEPSSLTKFSPSSVFKGYFTLLGSKDFMAAVLGLCFSITPYFILIGILPLLFMESLGVSINNYAFYQGSIVGLFSILSLNMSTILRCFEINRIVKYSLFLSVGALSLACALSFVLPDHPLLITSLMWMYVTGVVVPPTVMFVKAMDMFPSLRASASSLIQAIRMFSMSVGTAVAGFLYDGTFRPLAFIMVFFMAISVPLILMVFRKKGASETVSEIVSAVH